MIFDNSYSWTRGKRLYYHVELHMTDENTESEVDGFIPGEEVWANIVESSEK